VKRRSLFAVILAFAALAVPVGSQPVRETIVAPAPVFDGTRQVITSPIVIRGAVGQVIDGRNTRLIYRGPPTIGVIRFIGCNRCRVIDLEIVVESPGVDSYVVITNAVDPPNQGYSTACEIKNVRGMLGTTTHSVKRAFAVDAFAAGGKDANNDHHHFTDCYAQSYTECGYFIKGSQCHDIYYLRCSAHDAAGRKPVGLHAAGAVHFEWHRGGMNSNSIDFKLGSPETQAVIVGHNSENGGQFLRTEFAGECQFRACDVRWEGNPSVSPYLPVIQAQGPGPWKLENCLFSGLNGVCPRLSFNGSPLGSLDLSGILIRQYRGNIPTTAIITAPASMAVRQHGIKWQRANEDDSRSYRNVIVNRVPGVQ